MLKKAFHAESSKVSLRYEVQMPLTSCKIPGCVEHISTFWQTLIWISGWCPNSPPVHTLKPDIPNLFAFQPAQNSQAEGRAASHRWALQPCLRKAAQSKAVPGTFFSPHCRLPFNFFSLAVAITGFFFWSNTLLLPHKLSNDCSGNKKLYNLLKI